MTARLNNAKTLQRRHFLAGAAGTLLAPLAIAQTASMHCASAHRRPWVRFIRATRAKGRLRPMRTCCASTAIGC